MYKKSEIVRNNILNTAAKLYWEKGYKATRNIDIAQIADIPAGLISYYFPQKEILAGAVYSRINMDFQNEVTRIFPKELGENVWFACIIRAGWYYNSSCKEFQRFFLEIAKHRIQMQQFSHETEATFQGRNLTDMVMKPSNTNLGFADRYLNSRISAAIEIELSITYFENPETLSIEEMILKTTDAQMKLLGIPGEQICEYCQIAKKICDQYSFMMEPYFSAKIHGKD